jgi:hypothetical protein
VSLHCPLASLTPEGDLLLLLLVVLNVVILSEAKNPCISPLLLPLSVLPYPTNSA